MTVRSRGVGALKWAVHALTRIPVGRTWTWYLLSGVAVPSALLFAVTAGCYLLFTRVLLGDQPESTDGAFKDVLQTVLAIAAIVVGAFGLGVYRLFPQQVEKKVARNTEKRLRIANATNMINQGFVYWHLFLRFAGLERDERLAYIDGAIEVTRKAYEQEIADLGDSEREVRRLLLQIRNN